MARYSERERIEPEIPRPNRSTRSFSSDACRYCPYGGGHKVGKDTMILLSSHSPVGIGYSDRRNCVQCISMSDRSEQESMSHREIEVNGVACTLG